MMAWGLLNNIPMAPQLRSLYCICPVASGYQHPLMTNQVKYILIQFSRFYLSVLVHSILFRENNATNLEKYLEHYNFIAQLMFELATLSIFYSDFSIFHHQTHVGCFWLFSS